MVTTKAKFPGSIEEALIRVHTILVEEGLFDDPIDFPPDHIEQGKINLWNIAGEHFISKFIAGSEDYSLNEEEINKIIVQTIVQTNLDSLMADKLIDGIENEHGEMIYWMTDKGKDVYKNSLPESDSGESLI